MALTERLADTLDTRVPDSRTIVHVRGHQYTLRWAPNPENIVSAPLELYPYVKSLSIAPEHPIKLTLERKSPTRDHLHHVKSTIASMPMNLVLVRLLNMLSLLTSTSELQILKATT
jgi:hypothetical protein